MALPFEGRSPPARLPKGTGISYDDAVADTREHLVELLRLGYERRDEAIRLASGELSYDYVDGNKAIAKGENLRFVAGAVIEAAAARGAEFDAVGGLTMGADPIAHAVALISGAEWFSVRKEPKGHGQRKMIEGAELSEGIRALVVEDVVTTGGSILKAVEAVEDQGANVVLAVSLLDRGETAGELLAPRGVPYEPLATYEDLEIEPVGG